LALKYNSNASLTQLDRPLSREAGIMANRPENERLVFEGGQLEKSRRYSEATERFAAVIVNDPWDRAALAGLARMRYREGRFEEGRELVRRLLQLDAYDAEANFLAGIFYRALGSDTDAREAFGWAARSTSFRSAARTELAEIALANGDPSRSIAEASSALDFNRFNLTALEILASASRTAGKTEVWSHAVDRLLELDPLNLAARLEMYLADSGPNQVEGVRSALRSEFASEAILTAGVSLFERGLARDARRVLELGDRVAPSQMQGIWLAWLSRSVDSTASAFLLKRAAGMPIGSPYRTASIPALSWAAGSSNTWLWKYLLALDTWSMDRPEEALEIMDSLGNRPDSAAFYLARASLGPRVDGRDEENDLRRAVELEPKEPATRRALIQYLQSRERWGEALDVVESGRSIYRGPANFDVLAARSLVRLGRPDEAVELLTATRVLPSEGSAGGHVVYEEAHLLAGMQSYRNGAFEAAEAHFRSALEWPENLGAGKPYDPEERLPRYLLGLSLVQMDRPDDAGEQLRRVADASRGGSAGPQPEQILSYRALEALSGEGAEAERLALRRRFEEAAQTADPRGEWLLARAVGKTDRAEVIERSHPELFSGPGIRLLLKALGLTR
jgi:tetratricopeptide (TPR) repeat protein